MLILGIETSCDETAIAIVEDGRKIIANQIFSQIAKHQDWGGVIPELASRMHLEVINDLFRSALSEAKLEMKDIDAIAVTSGPGLIGSLLVGLNFAKTLALIHSKPLIYVNHLHGHVCANFIDSNLEPPFLCMLASGGHTQIIEMQSYTEMKILGETIDDAAGEAFDKVARLMGLPYPGGPHLDKLAQDSSSVNVIASDCRNTVKTVSNNYKFPIARVENLDFSFSGLKTAVLRLKQKIGEEIWNRDKALIAAAFQETVAKTFVRRVEQAIELTNIHRIVLAGGVSANTAVRRTFQEKFTAPTCELIIPSLQYCTDNAAMIASAGYFIAKDIDLAKHINDYALEPYARA